mmetsp:Transcript_80039/g.224676  ORF Transcript_80039/g.224676 Transcript_80039/m.224676 type:complete len:417 (-) Transcript_80039:119-1369(-)
MTSCWFSCCNGLSASRDVEWRLPTPSFHVMVVRGESLKNMELFGRQDPYCVVSLGAATGRTQTINHGGANPTWVGESGKVLLHCDPTARERLMHIVVYDSERYKRDDFVGEACINVSPLIERGVMFHGYVQVYRGGTQPRGRLLVHICPVPEPGHGISERLPDHCVDRLIEATPAKLHRNYIVGALNSVQEGDAYRQFYTYSVRMQRTPEVFQNVWHDGAKGQHPETFTNGPSAVAARAGLSMAHRQLYKGTSSAPSELSEKISFLGSGEDFLHLVSSGLRDGRRRVYTYSLIDEGLFFSETGAALSKDTASKHLIHANAAMSVRYAGTFRICQRPGSGERVLVIDNDSGTYQPSGSNRHLLQALLELNFPGLEVLALNIVEPQPSYTRSLIGPNEAKGDPRAVYAGTWRWAAAAE